MTEINKINEDILDLDISNINYNDSIVFEPKESLNSPRISQEIEINENNNNKEEEIDKQQNNQEEKEQNIPIQSPIKNKPLTKREAEIANRLYMEALAHSARMQDIQGRKHEECTFHPDISLSQSFKSNHPNESQEPATKRLYEEAAARKARVIVRSSRLPEDCSFKPTIIPPPALHSPHRSHSPELGNNDNSKDNSTKTTPRARGNTPTRLYESSKHKNEKLEALKKKVEQERLAECTFRPTTSRQPKSASKLSSSTQSTPDRTPLAERLYKDAHNREERLAEKAQQLLQEEKLRLEREKEERIRGGIPNAALKEKEKFEIQGSFQDRVRDSDRRLSKKLKELKDEQSKRETEECTFKPQIKTRPMSAGRKRKDQSNGTPQNGLVTPTKNQSDSQQAPSTVPVYLRLLHQGEELKKKKDVMREHFEQAEKEELTFRPSLVTGNRARSPSPQRGKPTQQQQQHQEQYQEQHQEQEENHLENSIQNGDVDNTPLKPIYNLGQETPEKINISVTETLSPQPTTKEHIPFYERLNQSGTEYKKRKEELREKKLSQENEDLTFQPIIVRSPYAARYTCTSPGHTMSPEGVIDNISVFERLSLAAQQKLLNEEKMKELAKKEFPFQPVLTARAKSVPKRRKPEEVSVPIYDRLIQAGVRRKTILIQSAKEKEEQELSLCTFQPTIPKESEALAVKAFAEEYNQILQEREKSFQKKPSSSSSSKHLERDDSSLDDNIQVTNYESDNFDSRFSRSLSSPLEHNRSRSVGREENIERNVGENEGLKRSASAGRLVRRGSIFDRLNKQQIHNSSFSDFSTISAFDPNQSTNTLPLNHHHNHHDSHSDSHSVASSSTHRSAPIRRDSLLLRPTISSAMKDKDYEEKPEPIQVPEPIKEIPISSPPKRRESLLFNPTASSKLKDLHTNPLPPSEPGCHDISENRSKSVPRSTSAPRLTPAPQKSQIPVVNKQISKVNNSESSKPNSPIKKSASASPVPSTKKNNSPLPSKQAPPQPFNPQKVIQRKKTTPPATPSSIESLIENVSGDEILPIPPPSNNSDKNDTNTNDINITNTNVALHEVNENNSNYSIQQSINILPPPPPSSSSNSVTPILTNSTSPSTKPALQLSHSLPLTISANSSPNIISSTNSTSPSHTPRLTQRTQSSIDTSASQANTDKAREAIAALQRSLKGGLGGSGDLSPRPTSTTPTPTPTIQIEQNKQQQQQQDLNQQLGEPIRGRSSSLAQHLFAQIDEHFANEEEEEEEEGEKKTEVNGIE